jgi:hypothetical protein
MRRGITPFEPTIDATGGEQRARCNLRNNRQYASATSVKNKVSDYNHNDASGKWFAAGAGGAKVQSEREA